MQEELSKLVGSFLKVYPGGVDREPSTASRWVLTDEHGPRLVISDAICGYCVEDIVPVAVRAVGEHIEVEFEVDEKERECENVGEWQFHTRNCTHG